MPDWTTTSGAALSAYAEWRELLARAFVRLEPDGPAGAGQSFEGRVEQCTAGTRALSAVHARAHTVRRLREHAARDATDTCFVNLQLTGTSRVSQSTRTSDVLPGDLVCVRTDQPFEIRNDAQFSLICLTLPTSDVPGALLRDGHLRLGRTDRGRRVAAMLRDYARLCLVPQKRDGAALLLDQAVALVGWFADNPGLGGGASPAFSYLRRLICEHAQDPDFGLTDCAALAGLAPRTLQDRCKSEGTTFSVLLRAARLDLAKAQLRKSNLSASILDVALASGFSDLSHFSRSFRAETGLSPRAWAVAHSDK